MEVWRKSSARLHRPRRATAEYAIAANYRRSCELCARQIESEQKSSDPKFHDGLPRWTPSLPELDTGGFSIATILSQGGAPVPPAPIGVSSGAPRADRNSGIDSWLLDRLFARR
jgi:hypothetical protein